MSSHPPFRRHSNEMSKMVEHKEKIAELSLDNSAKFKHGILIFSFIA